MEITGDTPAISNVKQLIAMKYYVKDLGILKHILGLQVDISPECVRISQSTYVDQLICNMGMADANVAAVPVVGGIDLDSDTTANNPVSSTHYHYLTGKFMYVMVSTSPRYCFCCRIVSKIC